jgi:hypothetical protein
VDDDRFAYYRGLLDRWQWLEVALCVTYVHGAGQNDVVRAFGGDSGDTIPLTLDAFVEEVAAHRRTRAPDAVLVTTVGDRVVCVEPNGFQGARREVLRPCSADSRALSVYWNVNHTNRLLYCVGGRTAVEFDMLRPYQRSGSDPAVLDEILVGLPFGHLADAWRRGWRSASG